MRAQQSAPVGKNTLSPARFPLRLYAVITPLLRLVVVGHDTAQTHPRNESDFEGSHSNAFGRTPSGFRYRVSRARKQNGASQNASSKPAPNFAHSAPSRRPGARPA